jgi:excisionase family DNA binding protein
MTIKGKGLKFPPSLNPKKGASGEKTTTAEIMTTKEMAEYLKLHQITICKLSKEGKIPSVRIGRVWRFDREVIDEWIAKGQNK